MNRAQIEQHSTHLLLLRELLGSAWGWETRDTQHGMDRNQESDWMVETLISESIEHSRKTDHATSHQFTTITACWLKSGSFVPPNTKKTNSCRIFEKLGKNKSILQNKIYSNKFHLKIYFHVQNIIIIVIIYLIDFPPLSDFFFLILKIF